MKNTKTETRQERLARYLVRKNARYDSACFQMFLWFPLPDGTWQIVLGEGSKYHSEMWRAKARAMMAKMWGISIDKIPNHFDRNFIPTGYVDFEDVKGREVMVLVVPTSLPSGWTVSRLKSELRCGDKLSRMTADPGRDMDQELVDSYVKMLKN